MCIANICIITIIVIIYRYKANTFFRKYLLQILPRLDIISAETR